MFNMSEEVDEQNNEINEQINENEEQNYENMEKNIDIGDIEEDEKNENEPVERKKRGPPKTLLMNKKKYDEILEKQNRMLNHKKKNKKEPRKACCLHAMSNNLEGGNQNVERRRLNIGGKIRVVNFSKRVEGEDDQDSLNNDNQKISKNYSHKIPNKYAKQIENTIKKKTIKNIKNFSDLRRITTIENIEVEDGIDTGKASIIELRKIKAEQRKKNCQETRAKKDNTKEDKIIQDIVNNEKMSKFSKTVAIRNLSMNSRRNVMKLKRENKALAIM